MNLKRKEDSTPQYNKTEPQYKKAPSIDWSLYEVDYDMPLPHGKYKGSSLGLVKQSDDWYYNWMISNNIIAEWLLIKPKAELPAKKNKDFDPFVASNGETWLCMYAVKVSTM